MKKNKSETLATAHTPLQPYDSNPFTLIFNSFNRFFKTNMWWGISLLVLGFLSFGWQSLSQFSSVPASNEPSPKMSSDSLEKNFSWLQNITPEQIIALSSIAILLILFVALISLVYFAMYTYVYGAFAYVALQSEKGKSVQFEEALREVNKRFWRLFLAQGLANIKIFLWTLLFIIPGIIAALRYALLTYVIMDQSEKEKGIVVTHTRTKQIVKGKLMEVFGMLVASGIIPFIGDTLRVTGSAAQYNQLSFTHDHGVTRPKTHLLNYIGFLLALLCVFLVVAIISFVAFVVYLSSQA